MNTWCHRTPAETPTKMCTITICVEEDLHSVAPARYDWRQKVRGRRWISSRVAAAVVHQGCPVPICDLDKVDTGGEPVNSKVGELQPQYLPTLHLYDLSPVEVGRIVLRVNSSTFCDFQSPIRCKSCRF